MQKDQQQKINIAVLLGGDSNEREISLESGRNIVYKLSPEKYNVIPIFVSRRSPGAKEVPSSLGEAGQAAGEGPLSLYRIDERILVHNSTNEVSACIKEEMRIKLSELPSLVDFVFIALHGGIGENGCIQGALEMLGLPYNGPSVFASALCMDKFKANSFLRAQGFEVPNNLLVSCDQWKQEKEQVIAKTHVAFKYPVIVKPHDDGCSVMVSKATNDEQLCKAIDELFAAGKKHAFIEECIIGMELTVGVIGNDQPVALPPSQAIANAGILSIEEKFLPGAGENQTPAPLPAITLALVQRVMAAAYRAVGCKGYTRIDCFYQTAEQSPTGAERVVILEFNTLPGMTPATVLFHQAAEVGIKPMDFVDMLVELGFAAHANHAPKGKAAVSEIEILRPINGQAQVCV